VRDLNPGGTLKVLIAIYEKRFLHDGREEKGGKHGSMVTSFAAGLLR